MSSYFLFCRKLDIRTFTANSALSVCEILSVTVNYKNVKIKYYFEHIRILYEGHAFKLSVKERPFTVHVNLSCLWGGTISRRDEKNKKRNGNCIENMAARRKDEQKNEVSEKQFVVM